MKNSQIKDNIKFSVMESTNKEVLPHDLVVTAPGNWQMSNTLPDCH